MMFSMGTLSSMNRSLKVNLTMASGVREGVCGNNSAEPIKSWLSVS